MIVIIGAGLAGLSAAHKLIQSGVNEFVILEAQKKIGGRIQSETLDDGTRLDLGAQWLHGEKSNPIYDWLMSLGCIDKLDDEESEFEGLFVTSEGRRAQPQVVSRVLEVLLDTKRDLYNFASLTRDDSKPVEIFHRSVEEAIAQCPLLKSADTNLIKAILRWFELYETIDNSCERLDDLSMQAYSGWLDFDDGKMVKLRGGWTSVVDILVRTVGCDKIRLSTEILQIKLNDDGQVSIILRDQPEIQCDHVIVTCSLGVLKQATSTTMNSILPILEESKIKKIERLGYGSVNKVFLMFEEPYLQEERGLKLIQTSDIKFCTCSNWTQGVLGFDLLDNAPKVLVSWIGGQAAREMDKVDDAHLIEVLLKMINTYIPDKPMPKLIGYTIANWSSNPYIRGAYSYPSSNCTDEDVTSLWDPVCDGDGIPRILFAGEATAGHMYATAHGAIVSGWREAIRLLKIIQKNS